MTLSNSSSYFAHSRTISMVLGRVLLIIAKVGSRRISTGLSLYLISGKGKGHFRYIEMLQSFFFST